MEQITVYTDGGCTNNPGVGGYGIVMLYPGNTVPKTYNKGYACTTNNRMELLAVIQTLTILKNVNVPIQIYTDSKYVVDSINTGWMQKWKVNNFTTCKNPDLWRVLDGLLKSTVTVTWVKGHSGNKWNEMADKLSKDARTGTLSVDSEFLRLNPRYNTKTVKKLF